jgi:hypothetical protein
MTMRKRYRQALAKSVRLQAGIALLTALLAATAITVPALAKGKPLDWKQASAALLRIDDHPAAEWNLYQVNKKNDLLLLKINARFLLFDVPRHQIFEIDPAKIEHKGEGLRWDTDDRPDKPLESADWLIRDVGDAYRFRVRLVAENHVFDVQIPHPLDLRNIY